VCVSYDCGCVRRCVGVSLCVGVCGCVYTGAPSSHQPTGGVVRARARMCVCHVTVCVCVWGSWVCVGVGVRGVYLDFSRSCNF
jgi:hypothetical protein